MSKEINYKDVLNQIFMIWLVCFGSLAVQVASGYFLSYVFMPYVGFLLMAGIIVYGNYNVRTSILNCSMMTHYTVYILAISGVIMLVANLLNTNFITNKYSQFSQQDYPYHTVFIIYPVATIYFAIAKLRRSHTEYCHACKAVANFSIHETLRRNVLHHECRFQINLALSISLFISVISYGYYFLYYRSGSLSKQYTPDVFFMYVFPVALSLLSIVYLMLRYSSMSFEISLSDNFVDNKATTRVRYLVVWKDNILLKETVIAEFGTGFWDTPADRVIEYNENISDQRADTIFRNMSGAKDFKLRKLFTTSNRMQTIDHFAVFLPDEKGELSGLEGKWFTLHDIDQMLKMGVITRAFAVEMHRIHTITMAWKTFDRNGRRLYPIKNYQPTFRLRDFKNWDVDYDDLHWISIAENNEDKHFFRLRQWWRTYISGIEPRWKRKKS